MVRLWRWPTEDWGHAHWFYRFLKATIEGLLKWLFRVHARGMENVPREGGAIYVMNHFSWIDPLMAGDVSPRPIFFLAKEGLFRNRLMAWFMTAMGQIKVDRKQGGNDAALNTAKALIDRGLMVGIYAEGTRSTYGEMLPFRSGAARLALATGAPVVPMAILSHHNWPKGQLLPRIGKRIYVNVGEPIRFGEKQGRENDREVCAEVTDILQGRVEALVEEAEQAYRSGERWRW